MIVDKSVVEPVITLRSVSKVYKLHGTTEQVYGLTEINLSDKSEYAAIRRGEFVMLRGASGCGKTTLLNILGTIDSPSSGEVEIAGSLITTKTSDSFLSEIRLKTIGFVFQSFNLLDSLTALENIELPMIACNKLSKKDRRERALELLKTLGLEDRADHLPSELSGGEKQRIAIARALSNKPEILLLDEPTGDLDTTNTIEVMDLLLKINQESKMTLVMVTHNPDVECYADRLIYLEDGKISRQIVNKCQLRLDLHEYTSISRRIIIGFLEKQMNKKTGAAP